MIVIGLRHRSAGRQAAARLGRAAAPARRALPGPRRQGGMSDERDPAPRTASPATADLYDEHGEDLQSCSVAAAHYGRRTAFHGDDQHDPVPP